MNILQVGFTNCAAEPGLIRNQTSSRASHPYEVLELLVVLQLFLVVADSLVVVTAEISVAVLHPLPYFT